VIVEGKLERFAAAGGAINVFVQRIGPIAAPDRPLAEVKDFSMLDERERRRIAEDKAASAGARTASAGARDATEEGVPDAAEKAAAAGADDFRAVAPPVMSFASGRRR